MRYEKNITRSILAVHVRRLQRSDIGDEGIDSGSNLQGRSIAHHASARDLISRTNIALDGLGNEQTKKQDLLSLLTPISPDIPRALSI